MALMHEVLDALRHEEATLNPKRWREAVDRLEAWMRDIEARLDGKAAAEEPHGLIVTHSPDQLDKEEETDAHEAPATR